MLNELKCSEVRDQKQKNKKKTFLGCSSSTSTYEHSYNSQWRISAFSIRNGWANGVIRIHRRKNNHRWKFEREWSCSVPVNRTVQYFSFPGNNGERSRPCNQQRAMGRHINGNNSQQLRDCQVVRQFTSLAASLAMFVIYGTWFNDGERIYNNFPLLMSHEPTTRADVYRVPSFWFIVPS